jgi:hypothetical protein
MWNGAHLASLAREIKTLAVFMDAWMRVNDALPSLRRRPISDFAPALSANDGSPAI